MIILKLKYAHDSKHKEFYALELGEIGDKLICILDEYISKNDAIIIRKNINKLKDYTLNNKITWFKENIPVAYKKGYRKIYINRLTVIDRLSIPTF